jgi:hypothetical protein
MQCSPKVFLFWFCFVLLLQGAHFDRPIKLFWGKHLGTPPKIKSYRGASFQPG